jgi:hypothetical protein
MNFEELIGSYDQSGSIEAHSLSIREHDGTLYTIFSYRASSGAGARYLARSRIGEVMLIDSVLYPLNPSSDQRIGYGLFDIAGEVYTCGEGVYRIIDNQLTPIEGNVVGLWMSEGPYSNGFMLANSQELWCYDGENWEDITPIGFEHGNDNRIHGLAYTDSTVILGVTEGKGEVRAIRGKVGIEEMKRFAQTIKQHWSGVLRFHQSRMTAGFLEGINRLVHEPTPILWTKCGVT